MLNIESSELYFVMMSLTLILLFIYFIVEVK